MGKEPTNGDWAAAVQELGEVAAEGLAGEAMICVVIAKAGVHTGEGAVRSR